MYKLPIRVVEKVYNFLILKIEKVNLGKRVKITGKLFIRNHGICSIGDHTTINCSFSSNPVGGPYRTAIAVDCGADLKIGNNVGISGCAIMCNKSIKIEDNVLIGSGCCIYDSDFHSIKYENRIRKNDFDFGKKAVNIHEGAFIGARTIILKGADIGRHSVIGAGSVVSGIVPDGEIWAGNPARFIKKIPE